MKMTALTQSLPFKLTALMFVFTLFTRPAHSEDLRKILSLSGYWKFSIGDDIQWASPAYDDSGWDQLEVPGQWEEQGYDDYNGYAWYRKTFRLDEVPAGASVILALGRIDDADMVYLNGKLLGKSGTFPPEFLTAYDRERKYTVPAGLLKEDAENVIAIRVYDTFLQGGIVTGPTGLFYDADVEYLSVRLNGRWKFHTGDNQEWRSREFNDEDWKRINVPSDWESQGYNDYDGYAWYRVNFRLPKNFSPDEKYLSLGKIDDTDEVYLNGRLIGSVHDLKRDGDYRRKGWEFNARRLYKIPEGLLDLNGINTLAVRVYDGQIRGGIYEGPVGIMSAENCKRFKNKYRSNRSLWDELYDSFVAD